MGIRTFSMQAAERFSSSARRCRLVARGKNAEILRIITSMRAPCQIALLLCLLLPAPLAADQVRLGSHQFTLPEGFTIEPACVPDLCSRPITATLDEAWHAGLGEEGGGLEEIFMAATAARAALPAEAPDARGRVPGLGKSAAV